MRKRNVKRKERAREFEHTFENYSNGTNAGNHLNSSVIVLAVLMRKRGETLLLSICYILVTFTYTIFTLQINDIILFFMEGGHEAQ